MKFTIAFLVLAFLTYMAFRPEHIDCPSLNADRDVQRHRKLLTELAEKGLCIEEQWKVPTKKCGWVSMYCGKRPLVEIPAIDPSQQRWHSPKDLPMDRNGLVHI